MIPFKGTVKDFLKRERAQIEGRSVCWFLDPPYQRGDIYEDAFVRVMEKMEGNDELWVQTGEGNTFETPLEPLKSFVQGSNRLDCYQREGR